MANKQFDEDTILPGMASTSKLEVESFQSTLGQERDIEQGKVTAQPVAEGSTTYEAAKVNSDPQELEQPTESKADELPPPEPEFVTVTYWDIFKQFFIMGWVAFGGPAAHIGLFQKTFVERLRWMKETVFLELFALGQFLPGPTSTQVSFALGIVKKGALGGLLSGVMFQYPGAFIMAGLGAGAADWLQSPKPWLEGVIAGLSAAGVALVASAAKGLLMKTCGTKYLAIVGTLSAGAAIYWSEPWLFALIIGLGGLATVVSVKCEAMQAAWNKHREASKLEPLKKSSFVQLLHHSISAKPEPPKANTSNDGVESLGLNRWGGAAFIATWAGVLILAITLARTEYKSYEEGNPLSWFEVFYRTGSIIYGGGQVVLPMLYEDLVKLGQDGQDLPFPRSWMTSKQFFAGLGVVQAMPGPLFNFSTYLGAIIAINYGWPFILGSVLAWFGLFSPGVLLMFGVLPFWHKFRQWQFYKWALPGMNAAGVGLILASVFKMTIDVLRVNPYDTSMLCIGLFAFAAVDELKIFEPFVILGGALLGLLAWGADLN